MAILSRKITTYTQNVKDLADTPTLTAAQLKAFFDGRGDNELKASINGIVDDLLAVTDGSSGADQIGATPVKDGGAETVQGVLEELKDVDNHVNGSVNKVFTATEKTKLGTIAEGAEVNTVNSVNTKTGTVVLDADDIDDTATTNKFTTAGDISKLAGIADNANNYVHPATHSADIITDGTTNKTFTAILKSAYDGLVTLFSGITSVVTTLGADNTSIPTSKAVADAISSAGGGDMLKSTYDPSNIGANVFSADNHVDGTTNKVFTATEQTKLGTIAENANNYSHPTGDGNLHVPANSTTNEGKVLTAGASAGTYTWETPTYGVGEEDKFILVRNGRWI